MDIDVYYMHIHITSLQAYKPEAAHLTHWIGHSACDYSCCKDEALIQIICFDLFAF